MKPIMITSDPYRANFSQSKTWKTIGVLGIPVTGHLFSGSLFIIDQLVSSGLSLSTVTSHVNRFVWHRSIFGLILFGGW